MTMTALAAASRLEAMAEGKGGANVPYSTGGPLARDAAVLIPLDELHAEYARCQERYRTEEHTVSGVGPQRPRKKHYPADFSPYRMTSSSARHRVVPVERRAAKDDIKAIEDGLHGFIGRRVRKAFPEADEKGCMVWKNFEGTVIQYSIRWHWFKVRYNDGDIEEYDMQELKDILIRGEE